MALTIIFCNRKYLNYNLNYISIVKKKLIFRYKKNQEYYSSESKVRVRFAPSPTGYLHLGGLRTALYNYLFARSHKGKFILRIEDTDSARTVQGSMQEIEKNLRWLSIEPDESPEAGGPYGSYIQSYRLQKYQHFSDILLQNGSAYKCFCSHERLKSLKFKDTFLSYDNKCRSLTPKEVKRFISEGLPYCIRFKLHKEAISINDLIHGMKEFPLPKDEGDTVLIKTSGIPTYHFASVVDDHLMKISHVLRGIDWLSSTPKHIQLYRCFGWEPPLFGHLPNISNLDGTKLSKRQHGLQIKNLQNEGYSPSAILNFIKLSGGGFKNINHEKLCTLEELTSKFDLKKINLHPAPYDIDRLNQYSHLDLQTKIMDENELKLMIEELKEEIVYKYQDLDVNLTDNFLKDIIIWSQNRIHKLRDLTMEEFKFLWIHPKPIQTKDMKSLKLDTRTILTDIHKDLEELNSQNFLTENISKTISLTQRKHNIKTVSLMKLLRLVLSGLKVGPPVIDMFIILGREASLQRLKNAGLLKV